jgi:hypothetical protein
VLRYCDAQEGFSESWGSDISGEVIWQISNDTYGYDQKVIALLISFDIFGLKSPTDTEPSCKNAHSIVER